MKDLTRMYFPDWYKCEYKQKVLDLANHIGRKKPGSKGAYQWDDPEYVILEAGVDDDMAEVGMGLGISEKRSVAQIAGIVKKPEDYCFEQLKKLAVYGVCFWNTVDGEEVF